MKEDKSYWEIFIAVLGIIAIGSLVILFFSSCKLFKEVKKDSSDSTHVVKTTESATKIDTSKSKTETSSTKETVYYPQPIYIKGNDGETKVIFAPQSTKETGTTKEENMTAIFEQFKKDFADSLQTIKKSKETEVKAGTDWLQIAILGGLALLVFKNFVIPYISFKKNKQNGNNERS